MKGIVKDASTGIPIQGAQIKVFNITGNRKIEHDIISGILIFQVFSLTFNFFNLRKIFLIFFEIMLD